MKWATVELRRTGENRLVFVDEAGFVDIHQVYRWYCTTHRQPADTLLLSALMNLNSLLEAGLTESVTVKDLRSRWLTAVAAGDSAALNCRIDSEDARFILPFQPVGFRDFYAFERHVSTCRARRGLEMVPEWYEIPVFYFSNPRCFVGTGEEVVAPMDCKELDFELEIACVIGKSGRSIAASKAEHYIAGYAILNDWSARDIQRQEVKVGLGPAKGKDFCTSIGPLLVTPEELEADRAGATDSEPWGRFHLEMKASVNGRCISRGNFKDIHYSFAQMIERASRDTTLVPGDVIGSGTVGTGCILELGTEIQPWLEPGDEVELEISKLGTLRNVIGKRR